MSQKNDVPALLGALLVTVGVVGGGVWWFTQKSGQNLGQVLQNGSNSGTSTGTNSNNNQPLSAVKDVPSGQFRYGGSTSWAPIRLSVDSALQTARSEFRLSYVNPSGEAASTSSGIKMLLNRQIEFAQTSRPVNTKEQQQAQQLGLNLLEIPVAIDGLAVAVNPSLNVPGLTLDQLKAIYTGQLTNWQAVGGPNLPIVPLSRKPGSGGTVDLFMESVLGGGSFSPGVQFVDTTTQALQRLGATAGSIYFASAPEVVPQCTIKPLPLGRAAGQFVPPYREPLIDSSQCPAQRNQLNHQAFQNGDYPLTRNLYVVFKQDGQRSQQVGQAYANLLLSGQGQGLLEQTGFVRIR
ncbi:PstS family phosphate ABC transporter substrate-binding protein [Alkalinema sp. FACHB-956]|uniref:PstS family phosphate ABC transporter substrate-binding protein n=1 Tax=Alkalinema sp. FACHB-956 TaxID=2692768 RepID=UPI0016879FFF|nr:PstS family phosphate ABC transporter substrate-binding protein [Alkalinema sp. FACHB-956]MBD2326791.1 PstS family phosphate ABC transporter substrate-binding protein [Alkalinema sp. FACHB-956]